MKFCKTCGTGKPFEAFSKSSRNKDGLQSKCKECFSAYYSKTSGVQRQRYADWYANPDNVSRRQETRRKYKASEEGRKRIKSLKAKRRALERGAHITDPLISKAFEVVTEKYGEVCMFPECVRVDVELDHIIPLSLGGEHTIANLQLLCEHHNRSKGNRSCADYRPESVI